MPGKKAASPDVHDGAPDNNQASAAGEGAPVATCLAKRLRAARKKLNRITELEAKQAAGAALTEEQIPVVASKGAVQAVIEELDKLQSLMADAVKEEQALVRKQAQEDAQAAVAKQQEAAKAAADAAAQRAADAARADAEAALAAAHQAASQAAAEAESRLHDAISKLVTLGYFSALFDPDGPWTCHMERKAFLTYGTPLGEGDLVALASFGRMLRSRPLGQLVSHKEALAACVGLAHAYVCGDDARTADMTGGLAGSTVHSHVAAILSSNFSTIKPEQQGSPPPTSQAPPVMPVQPPAAPAHAPTSAPQPPLPAVRPLGPPQAPPAEAPAAAPVPVPAPGSQPMTVADLEHSLFTRSGAPAAAQHAPPAAPPQQAAPPNGYGHLGERGAFAPPASAPQAPPAALPQQQPPAAAPPRPPMGAPVPQQPQQQQAAPQANGHRAPPAPPAAQAEGPARAGGAAPPAQQQQAAAPAVKTVPRPPPVAREGQGPAPQATAGGRGGFGGRGGGSRACYECGGEGHLARECPQRAAGGAGARGGGRGSGRGGRAGGRA